MNLPTKHDFVAYFYVSTSTVLINPCTRRGLDWLKTELKNENSDAIVLPALKAQKLIGKMRYHNYRVQEYHSSIK